MYSVVALTPILQALMTTRADELAEQAEFIRRRGRYTAAEFLQALTFGFLKRKGAPLEALAQPLGISRQALDKRLDKGTTVAFCRLCLLEAVKHLVDARPALAPLLGRFNGAYLDDCTSAWMPDGACDDFPGTGGSHPDAARARMKVLLRWEIQAGNVCHLGIHAGRTADHDALAQAPALPEGALHLCDLGFCDFGRMHAEAEQGVYFLSRLPAQARLYRADGADLPLAEQLAAWRKQGVKAQDVTCGVGNKDQVWGRLVALACPADVAARRLANLHKDAKHRGRQVSARQREMCHWTALFSNIPADWLSAEQLWILYRLRWQIELLFKRFKAEGGLAQSNSGKRHRVEAEWYVKLLAQVVRNWAQLLRGGPLCDVNPVQLGRVITDHVGRIAEALRNGEGLLEALAELEQELLKVRRRTARRKRQTAARIAALDLEKLALEALG
jgi:Transposase DDE domain